jgi:hypothetical protein
VTTFIQPQQPSDSQACPPVREINDTPPPLRGNQVRSLSVQVKKATSSSLRMFKIVPTIFQITTEQNAAHPKVYKLKTITKFIIMLYYTIIIIQNMRLQ